MRNSTSPQQDYSNWSIQRLKFHKYELEESKDGRDRHTRKRVAAIIRDREAETKSSTDFTITALNYSAYGIKDENYSMVDKVALDAHVETLKNNVRSNISQYPFAEAFKKYPDGIISEFEIISENHGWLKIKTSEGDSFIFRSNDIREGEPIDLMDAYVLINESRTAYSNQNPAIPRGSIITDISDCDFRVEIKDQNIRDGIYGDKRWGYGDLIRVDGQNINIAPFAKCKISEISGRQAIDYSLHMS